MRGKQGLHQYLSLSLVTLGILSVVASLSHADTTVWLEVKAKDKYDRSLIEESGFHIEAIEGDKVTVSGNERALDRLSGLGRSDLSFEVVPEAINPFNFPSRNSEFHNYSELTTELQQLANENPDIVALENIGTSVEGRTLFNVRISTDLSTSSNKPGIVFMGGHHAREHLSIEIPFLLVKYLVTQFRQGDQRINNLIRSREIHIIPCVNPDGAEYDITGGSYRGWRKNRKPNGDGSMGVDLNRNYGYMWGGRGASPSTGDDTYRGRHAFSEPETQAIKNFVDTHPNLSILLSFHTFSQLILYPPGYTFDPMSDQRDRRVHEVMAQTMARWNRYTPQQSSDLYIASGDTTDWSYGAHQIISFTFELDPRNMFGGGFYPGQAAIRSTFEKNLEPCLYLIDHADNPYRVLTPGASLGFNSNLLGN